MLIVDKKNLIVLLQIVILNPSVPIKMNHTSISNGYISLVICFITVIQQKICNAKQMQNSGVDVAWWTAEISKGILNK